MATALISEPSGVLGSWGETKPIYFQGARRNNNYFKGASNWKQALNFRELELLALSIMPVIWLLGVGAKQNNFRMQREIFSWSWGDFGIIFREQESTDAPGGLISECFKLYYSCIFSFFIQVIQTAMVPIGFPGPVHSPGLHLDMYTATALLSAVVGVINIVLLVVVFKEHTVPDEDLIPDIQGSRKRFIWAATCQNVSSGVSDEARLKPAYSAIETS